ncbi:Prophage CP4-57 regulatory protein (AlpA) [compost metagenome]
MQPSHNILPIRPAGAEKAKAIGAATPFDPSTTLIRMPELLAVTGIGGRATVYKLLKEDPIFPKPVPLSTSTARGAPVAWVLAEVQDWIRARIAARGSAA